MLNGDISEDAAKYQAKALVHELQSQKARAQYHMIQRISSDEDVSDAELLHVPIWFVRYDHNGNKIVLVVDGNSGNVINSMGLKPNQYLPISAPVQPRRTIDGGWKALDRSLFPGFLGYSPQGTGSQQYSAFKERRLLPNASFTLVSSRKLQATV